VKPQRSQKKAGPRTDLAWLIDMGVKAYQHQHRLSSLEQVQAEIADELAISVRTLQSWRAKCCPKHYEDLQKFAAICLTADPRLGQHWAIDLFRAAGLASYTDQALREIGLGDRPAANDDTARLCDRLVTIHYLSPEPIFEQVQLQNFVGREWLDAKVDAFLHDRHHRSGVFVLTGEAGIGKTAYLAHLVRERQYLHVFGDLVKCQTPRAQRSLAVQLIQRYHLESQLEADDVTNCLEHSDLFLQRALRQAAQQLKSGEQLVIVVDICREWQKEHDSTLLDLPAILPAGVYLLVSQGPVATALGLHTHQHTERLTAASTENLQDIQHYMRTMIQRPEMAQHLIAEHCPAQDFETALVQQCGANWASTHSAIQRISWGHRTIRELTPVPVSRAIYHTERLGAWRTDWQRWEELYAPLMATLAAVQEPLPVVQLIRWAGVQASGSEVKRLLRECWCGFVREHHDSDWGCAYAFSYSCLHEFASGNVEREGLPPECLYLIEDLQERTIQAHGRIVDDLRQLSESEWMSLKGQDYVESYLKLHQARARGSQVN
jgi:hypothetical protein